MAEPLPEELIIEIERLTMWLNEIQYLCKIEANLCEIETAAHQSILGPNKAVKLPYRPRGEEIAHLGVWPSKKQRAENREECKPV